ncbi:aggrephagy protein, partial [Trichomonas vaginalis G3]
MQNQALLNETEIYSSILEEGPFQLSSFHTDIPYIDKIVSLQLIPANDYFPFLKRLQSSDNPRSLLSEVFENIPFDEESLLTFINSPNLSLKSIYISSYYIHLAFLTWIAANKDNSLPPKSLISAISFISDSSIFGDAKESTVISHSIFYFLFNEFLSKEKTNFSDYTSYLVIFLTQNRHSPDIFYKLLLLAVPTASERNFSTHIEDKFYDYLLLCTSLDLPSSVASEFIQSIVYHISALDYNSISVFQKLCPYLREEDNLNHFMELISMAIVNAASTVPHCSVPEKGEIVEVDDSQADNSLLQFLNYDSFPNGLNIEEVKDLTDVLTINDLIGSDFITKIDVIISILKFYESKVPDFMNNLFSCIKCQIKSSYTLQLFGVVLYMANAIPQIQNMTILDEMLHSKALFCPEITIYNNPENFAYLSLLRNYALRLFLTKPEILINYLSEVRKYPLLFAEIMYRFIAIGGNSIPSNLITSSLIKSALFYRTFDNDSTRKALLSIFFVIHTTFQQKTIVAECFSSRFFAQEFLVFSYEPKIRQFVLSNVRSYLVSEKDTDINLLHLLSSYMDITCPMFPAIKSVELVSDLLHTITDVLIHKWQLAGIFEKLLFTLIKCGAILEPTPESEEFIDSFIGYLAQVSIMHTLTNPELNAVENIIKNIYPKGPPIKIFLKLVQVAASTALASQSTSIIVKQPKVLHLIIDLYQGGNSFGEVIRFLGGICQYSYKNCLALHIGEIDLKLISILKTDQGAAMSTDIFTALNRISTVISSVSFMQKYVSLICPQNGIISQLNIDALRAITSNMSIARRIPLVSMPFSNDSIITIKD